MPFEPVIGSSFDAIAGQRAGWAGFSNQIDEANLRRAAFADEARNRYNENLARMQESEAARQDAAVQAMIDRQTAAQARAGDRASQQQQFAEGKRQFDVGTGLQQQQMSETARLSALQTAKKAAEDEQQVENWGRHYANELKRVAPMKEEADAALAQLEAQQEALNANKTPTADELRTKAALPNLIKAAAKHKADLDRAYEKLVNPKAGYEVDEALGVVTHPETGKTWSFKQAMAAAPSAAPTGPAPDLSTILNPDWAKGADTMPTTWAGFQPPEAQPQAVASPLKIGRFSVVPR